MKNEVYRFRITLREVDPPIWRLIEVPATATFWDLHVAIQDAMGWLDCHLHGFRLDVAPPGSFVLVGLPGLDGFAGGPPVLPGWQHGITEFFSAPGVSARYDYDFGDGWEHDVVFEAVAPRVKGQKVPRCLDGARACPPEDCGGPYGYERLLGIIADPGHEEYEDTIEWLGGTIEPEVFDPAKVRFENPKTRLKLAFGQR